MGVWIIAVFLVLFVAIGVFNHRNESKRRSLVAQWAERHHLEFLADHDSDFGDRFPQFDVLGQGSDRYAYNICRGIENGRAVVTCDGHYTTTSGTGKDRKTHHHHFSAVILDCDLIVQSLFIRTETWFDKMAEFVGFDDIDFELDEFNRHFHVKSPDRRWAFDVLHQETMEFLLASPRFHLQFAEGAVIAYRDGRFDPADFDDALAVAGGVLDRLPQYLAREIKGKSS
jgi:hypothetical protein